MVKKSEGSRVEELNALIAANAEAIKKLGEEIERLKHRLELESLKRQTQKLKKLGSVRLTEAAYDDSSPQGQRFLSS